MKRPSLRAASQFPIPAPHYFIERQDIRTRIRLLKRLCSCFAYGQRDPELLYLGLRTAVSLRLLKQARLFHEALERMLISDGRPCPAYFPIGLLYFQVADTDREPVLKRLRELATASVTLESALLLTGADVSGRLVFHSPLQSLDSLRSEQGRSRLGFLGSTEAPDVVTRFAKLGHSATEAYNKQQPARARRILESSLELDGDQPDVLRNLLTIASEQRDSVAYERYWRRYVDALLFRMLRRDHADAARRDLFRFYLKVAELTDRDFEDHKQQIHDHLRTPGLLARWLEAHAGLIWLNESERAYQSPITPNIASSLARWWLQLFSPAVAKFLAAEAAPESGWERPCAEARSELPFDPAERLLVRFAEWSKLGFSLEKADAVPTPYLEIVLALVACVARIPRAQYIAQLQPIFDENRVKPAPFKTAMQTAVSLPLQIAIGPYFQEKNWEGLIRMLGDPELKDALCDDLRMNLAMAYALKNETRQAITIALQTLPDIPLEELKENGYGRNLWMNVIQISMKSLCERFEGTERITAFTELKTQLDQIPDHHPELEELKLACLIEVDELEQQLSLNQLIDETIERSQALVQENKFAEALALVEKLPTKPDAVRDIRQKLLDQLGDVQKHHEFQERLHALVSKGKIAEAQRLVNTLPEGNDEERQAKQSLNAQLARAEQHAKLEKTIDDAIRRSKNHVERGKFAEAKAEIRKLPDEPSDVRELKASLLNQIASVEADAQAATKENPKILGRLISKNVDVSKLHAIARENDVDMMNPLQFNAFLKAVEAQVNS